MSVLRQRILLPYVPLHEDKSASGPRKERDTACGFVTSAVRGRKGYSLWLRHLYLFPASRLARKRSVGSRIFLRIRKLFGVISRSSSVSIKSSACSRLKILGGVSFKASSAPEERVLGKLFLLADIYLNIIGTSIFTNNHTSVNRFTRSDK